MRKVIFWVLLGLLMLPSLACALSAAVQDRGQLVQSSPILREEQPALIFLAPQSNNRYAVGAEVLLHVEARDLGDGITRIEFYDNFDAVIETVNAPNDAPQETMSAVATWTVPTAQRHFLRAKAFRADGTESDTAELSIEGVSLEGEITLPPAVSLLAVAGSESIPANLPDAPMEGTPGAIDETATQALIDATQEASVAPTLENSLTATVVGASALNIRLGPNRNAEIVNNIPQGSTLEIVGHSADNLWYVTPLPDGVYGWVYGQYLEFDGDPSTLPLVDAP